MMRIVCAWCDKSMGEKMGPDGLTTHGICPACEARVAGELLARKQTCPTHGPHFPARNFTDDGYGCPECDKEKEARAALPETFTALAYDIVDPAGPEDEDDTEEDDENDGVDEDDEVPETAEEEAT